MIKIRSGPCRGIVTQLAVSRIFVSYMRWSRSRSELIQMTTRTISRSPGITIRMTTDTSYPDMTSGQWKCCSCIMIERVGPPGSSSMTNLAVGRKFRCQMIRAYCCIVIGYMTVSANCGCPSCITISMAIGTGHRSMCACQWKGGGYIMIKC